MKVEMGESLIYSWLRHVKGCQIVQTNWKISPCWTPLHENELENIMDESKEYFKNVYEYDIYGKTSSVKQLLKQAESDVFGITGQERNRKIYAVDVAFHEGGLNYKNPIKTASKITAKYFRTAMCIYGYLDIKEAEIIFASPKISNSFLEKIKPCIKDVQEMMNDRGFCFHFDLIANEDFRVNILEPVLGVSKKAKDTTELFLRSYQMLQMFEM